MPFKRLKLPLEASEMSFQCLKLTSEASKMAFKCLKLLPEASEMGFHYLKLTSEASRSNFKRLIGVPGSFVYKLSKTTFSSIAIIILRKSARGDTFFLLD